jgi:uncharacterized protein GlcG (DUF336 family)
MIARLAMAAIAAAFAMGTWCTAASAQMLDKKALSIAAAKKIAAAAMAEAEKNNWTVVVAILDDGGNLMYLERRDGTQLASAGIAVGKARTALMYKRPTKVLEDVVNTGGRPSVMTLSPDIVAVEGGLPLVHDGVIIGAIGVSGVTSPQDGVVAKAGADTLK